MIWFIIIYKREILSILNKFVQCNLNLYLVYKDYQKRKIGVLSLPFIIKFFVMKLSHSTLVYLKISYIGYRMYIQIHIFKTTSILSLDVVWFF